MNTFPSSARAAVLVLAACTKKAADAPAPAAPLGMSWAEGGRAVKTTNVSISYPSSPPPGQPAVAELRGTALSDTTGVELYLTQPFTVGTFAVMNSSSGNSNPTSTTAVCQFATQTPYGLYPVYRATSGTVTVTDVTNGTVSGTFSFTAVCAASTCVGGSTRTITNGVFRLR